MCHQRDFLIDRIQDGRLLPDKEPALQSIAQRDTSLIDPVVFTLNIDGSEPQSVIHLITNVFPSFLDSHRLPEPIGNVDTDQGEEDGSHGFSGGSRLPTMAVRCMSIYLVVHLS